MGELQQAPVASTLDHDTHACSGAMNDSMIVFGNNLAHNCQMKGKLQQTQFHAKSPKDTFIMIDGVFGRLSSSFRGPYKQSNCPKSPCS